MLLIKYSSGGEACWGVKRDEVIHQLTTSRFGNPTWNDLANGSYLGQLERRVQRGKLVTHDLNEVNILPPVEEPKKIVGVGLNYEDHITEQDAKKPEKPLLFAKATSAIIGHREPIVLPSASEQVDYEAELAVIMGRTAKNITAEEAVDYIAGYTIINDVSARDAQFTDGQFFRGKSYETFGPIGPVIQTSDTDPGDKNIDLRVNGESKQHSNTSQLIFDVPELIEFITDVMTLYPGDIIATGTPGGVGIFSDPPDLLKPGDVVDVEIEGIGTLTNPTVAENDNSIK